MPAAIPLVAAVAGSAVTGAIGTGILASVAGFVVSTAISQIGGRMLAKKPKQQAFASEAGGRSVVIRSSVESHKVIYGQAKVSGPLVFVTTTDTGTNPASGPKANKFLHMVIALAGHEVEEIGAVYFNDRIVTLNGSGFVTSAPYQKSVTTTSLANIPATVTGASRTANVITLTTSAPHTFLVGEVVNITGLGFAFGFNGQHVIASTPTPTTFTYASSGSNTTLGIGDPGLAVVTRVVTTTTITNYALVRKHLGADDQTADAVMIANIPGWTSQHRLRGVAYLYVRLEYDQDVFPLGIPNISAVVKGKKVYDPRTDTTAWSDNAALCARDYFASEYGFDCAADEINDTYFEAAANICDESVSLIGGGTQARYTANGVVDTATAPLENLNALLTSMAGVVTFVQGKFRLYAGAYDMPAATVIDEDMLAGPITVRARTPRKELFNAVKGTYVDPNKSWQPTDFPFVTNATYEAQDGGERIFRDVELPFTTHPQAAQRIGKILLEKARQGIIVETVLKHHALQFCAYDVVKVTNAALGWSEKPFRLLKWRIADVGAIAVVMQEESSASYDWNSGEATENDDAPDTNLPNPFVVVPPGAPQITETKYITRTGDGVKSKATVTWGASPDAFVKEYQLEYALAATLQWVVMPRTAATTQDIEDIDPGTYVFRVKAINGLGVSSPYTDAVTRVINGLLDPPSEPQNPTISTIGGLAFIRWDEFTGQENLDVRIGGKIVFRHSPDVSSTWGGSTSIGEAVPGSATLAILPLKPGRYFAKAVDSSGTFSVAAASVTTAQATALEYGPVDELVEHPDFAGAKTNCYVTDANLLSLAGAGLFSDIPLLSEVESVASFGGTALAGVYEFSAAMDFGTVRRIRLTSHVKAQVVNVLDRIGARETNISTWESFSGTADTAHADARVYARTTDDDPLGTPVWRDYERIDSAEILARAVDPQLRLTSNDPAFNIRVSELKLTAEEVV